MAGAEESLRNAASKLAGLVRGQEKAPDVQSATVTRVDDDGTVWVAIAGSSTETPVRAGMAAGVGDKVSVRLAGGSAVLTDNVSRPATDDSLALQARFTALDAQDAADMAAEVAGAIGQHFWTDEAGVHVSNEEGKADGSRNSIFNSLGLIFREGANYLMGLVSGSAVGAAESDRGMAIFDGLGNAAANVIAWFGRNGIRIGRQSEQHVEITAQGISITNGSTAGTVNGVDVVATNTTANAASTTANAAKSEIDNLAIGGRNLVWDTEWNDVATRWTAWGTPQTREIVTAFGSRYLHVIANGAFQGYQQNQAKRAGTGEVSAGDKIMVSYTAYANTENDEASVGVHWRSASAIVSQSWCTQKLTTSPRRYTFGPFTVPTGAVQFNVMVGAGSPASTYEVWVGQVMVEKGTKASEWMPAPEDRATTGSVSAVSTKADNAATAAGEAATLAAQADGKADTANATASKTQENFWADSGGVHVSTQANTAAGTYNSLFASTGLLFRNAANTLVSLTKSALNFYDGAGNAEANITASYGADSVRIGKVGSGKFNTYVDANGIHLRNNATDMAALTATSLDFYDTSGASALNLTTNNANGNVRVGRADKWHALIGSSYGFQQKDTAGTIRMNVNNNGFYLRNAKDGDTAAVTTAELLANGTMRLGKLADYHYYGTATSLGLYPGGNNTANNALLYANSTPSVRIGAYASPHAYIDSSSFGFYPASSNAAANAILRMDTAPSVRIGKVSDCHLLMEKQRLRGFDENQSRTWLDFNRTAITSSMSRVEFFYPVSGQTQFTVSYEVASVTSVKAGGIDYAQDGGGIYRPSSNGETTYDSTHYSRSGRTFTFKNSPYAFTKEWDVGWLEIRYNATSGKIPTTELGLGSTDDITSTLDLRAKGSAVFEMHVGDNEDQVLAGYPDVNNSGLNLVMSPGGSLLLGGGRSAFAAYGKSIGEYPSGETYVMSNRSVYLVSGFSASSTTINNTWEFDALGDLTAPRNILAKGDITADGKLYIEKRSGNAWISATRIDKMTTVHLGVGSGGTNHGVYSDRLGKWLLYGSESDVHAGAINVTSAETAMSSLGLGSTTTATSGVVTAASGWTVVLQSLASWGRVRMLHLRVKNAEATSGTRKVATLAAAHKPKGPDAAIAVMYSPTTGSGYVNTSGEIYIGGSLAANTEWNGMFVWLV